MLNYLFSTNPGSFKQYGWLVLIYFVLLLALGLGLQVYLTKLKGYHPVKKLFRKLVPWAYLSGALGLILWFIRYERAPYLSMRFFLWLLIFGGLYWFLVIVITDLKQWEARKKQREEELKKRKYLKQFKTKSSKFK